jgi:uncharacterized protein involved in response to NO
VSVKSPLVRLAARTRETCFNRAVHAHAAPAPRPSPGPIEPYRILFPIGLLFALTGGAVWPLHVLGVIPYPGTLHAELMIQGFEQCFIVGFLLTAMPAFTHATRCRPWELAVAAVAVAGFGAGTLAGSAPAAQAAFLLSLAILWLAGLSRVVRNPNPPPEEFLFVAFGLALGTLGGTLLLAGALGVAIALPPRFPERLLSLGMVLSLVVGVGSLLVPTFAGMRNPLVIPGVAAPHARRGRRILYGGVIAALAFAFAAEGLGRPRLGMTLRALAVTTMGIWVWKLTRLPRRDAPGWALWGSGWMVMAGMWCAALFPGGLVAGLHVAFLGGYAVLTLGIGTRVLVSHGRHPLETERRALDPWVLGLVLGALTLRLVAEWQTATRMEWLAASGSLWIAAWLLWAARALPALMRPRPRT